MAAPPGPDEIEGEPRDPPTWVRYIALIVTVIMIIAFVAVVTIAVA